MSDAMLNSILTTYPFSASKHTQQRLSVRQLSVTDYGATFSHPDDLKTIQIAFAAVVELLSNNPFSYIMLEPFDICSKC